MVLPGLGPLIGSYAARKYASNGPGDPSWERKLSLLAAINPIEYAIMSIFYHWEKAKMIERGEEVPSMHLKSQRKS